jgi:hypothetical protein
MKALNSVEFRTLLKQFKQLKRIILLLRKTSF